MNDIRTASIDQVPRLARIWHKEWNDAHAQIVPADLVRVRTVESFEQRLRTMIADVRVATNNGEPVGFCIVKDDELYQLFVSAEVRGTGVAAQLVADAESILERNGVTTAWLACAINNHRAARFYEKCGWRMAGNMINEAVTDNGVFELETWRYEKVLSAA